MPKYIVNTLCILNQENPTPSKSMDIAINIIPVQKNKKFENFVLGIDDYSHDGYIGVYNIFDEELRKI